jgi:hypothetical protein
MIHSTGNFWNFQRNYEKLKNKIRLAFYTDRYRHLKLLLLVFFRYNFIFIIYMLNLHIFLHEINIEFFLFFWFYFYPTNLFILHWKSVILL